MKMDLISGATGTYVTLMVGYITCAMITATSFFKELPEMKILCKEYATSQHIKDWSIEGRIRRLEGARCVINGKRMSLKDLHTWKKQK